MADRNVKQWKKVINLYASGANYAEIGRAIGITRERARQIIVQAKYYMNLHDDELAEWICKSIDSRII